VGGGVAKRIARDVGLYDWSPDGKRFVLERDNELWVVDADGASARRLTRSGYARTAHEPRWSPEGSFILHDRYEGGDEGLWVMRVDGADARKIVNGEIMERVWSPDGAHIAFGRTGEQGGLFVIDRDGQNERRMPLDGGGSFGGWAADGKRIAVGGDTAGTLSPDPYPIVVLEVDTQRATLATENPKGER
jgi:Tol biopolymer transport system component